MEKVRTFVAIKLTPEIISNIGRVQEELKRTDAQVRWVKPENIHLTLKFLAHVTPEELEKAKITTKKTIGPFAPFEMSVASLGAFPRMKYPRVIWVGIDKGREELKRMASHLEEELAIVGFAKEKRPFSPHLTLGRVKSSKGRERLVEAFTKLKASNLGNMRVTQISIMKSELKPQGPIYTSLEEIVLGGEREC